MTEKPILFNAWSIPRILAEAKTQTRRVVKPQIPEPYTVVKNVHHDLWGFGAAGCRHPSRTTHFRCPYGCQGDRLWVRETWATVNVYDRIKPSAIPRGDAGRWPRVWYRAADSHWQKYRQRYFGQWRPSIFMPRWASRILLENREVRVERVQDISEQDAIGEGWPADDQARLTAIKLSYSASGLAAIEWFADLWDSINAKPKRAKRNPYTGEPEDCYVGYPWEDRRTEHKLPSGRAEYIVGNPWTWAVTFSLLEVLADG